MKRMFICLMSFVLLVTLASCNGNTSTSSVGGDGSAASAEPQLSASSEAAESSELSAVPEESSQDEPVPAESSESAESSAGSSDPAESSEVTPDPGEFPEFIANYISVGEVNTKIRAESEGNIRLTGIDVPLSYGDVVLYTYKTSKVIGLKDYAVAKFEYSAEQFGYTLTGFTEPGITSSERVPGDGFLICAHKDRGDIINKLCSVPLDKTVFVHGVQPCKDIGFTVKKLKSAVNIDGKISAGEWDPYKIDDINGKNKHWSYAQFDVGNYYVTASYFAAYDDDYIYLCVEVDSPFHYCPIASSKPNDMWRYECIQVKVSSESPDSAYILEHFDHVTDGSANNDGVVRAYGFAVNDDGETCYYENSAVSQVFGGLVSCSRDDGIQKTVYEVAIPWAEFGINPEKGMELGLTFSINSTNEEDFSKDKWKNVTYRDGGGVIGRNDWSKIPKITLG